jgi:predicted RNA-binding protein (virulence factor B family)
MKRINLYGRCDVGVKSPPQLIQRMFGLSKLNFKNAGA